MWLIIASLLLQTIPGISNLSSGWQEIFGNFNYSHHSLKHDAKKLTGQKDSGFLISETEEDEEESRKKNADSAGYCFGTQLLPSAKFIQASKSGFYLPSGKPKHDIPLYLLYGNWKYHLSKPVVA
jgi:hypothetical protein